MRFLNKEHVQAALPAEWDDYVRECWAYVTEKMGEAEQEAIHDNLPPDDIAKAKAKARKEAINKKASLWRLFAKHVKHLTHEKCWYCESKEDRSRMPVDHFRPKASVDGCADHGGYWWHAFNWENYRYCCTLCNSLTDSEDGTGGKGDKFPLLPGSIRCTCQTDDMAAEHPILLDPCRRQDVRLLTFKENGMPFPSAAAGTVDYLRADETAKILNLHHNKARVSRLRIAARIKQEVALANPLLEKRRNGIAVDAELEAVETRLSVYLDDHAPYRTAARIYFTGNRTKDNAEWQDEFLARL